jgi:hypothetical protein
MDIGLCRSGGGLILIVFRYVGSTLTIRGRREESLSILTYYQSRKKKNSR